MITILSLIGFFFSLLIAAGVGGWIGFSLAAKLNTKICIKAAEVCGVSKEQFKAAYKAVDTSDIAEDIFKK